MRNEFQSELIAVLLRVKFDDIIELDSEDHSRPRPQNVFDLEAVVFVRQALHRLSFEDHFFLLEIEEQFPLLLAIQGDFLPTLEFLHKASVLLLLLFLVVEPHLEQLDGPCLLEDFLLAFDALRFERLLLSLHLVQFIQEGLVVEREFLHQLAEVVHLYSIQRFLLEMRNGPSQGKLESLQNEAELARKVFHYLLDLLKNSLEDSRLFFHHDAKLLRLHVWARKALRVLREVRLTQRGFVRLQKNLVDLSNVFLLCEELGGRFPLQTQVQYFSLKIPLHLQNLLLQFERIHPGKQSVQLGSLGL